mmetsp:Transcript_95169/g.188542  ORF Transcript_95169/g.188542 Transcript_95169/m.188542 type:complete len:89 (+) Transcript_95169:491-757(+)
MRKSTLHLSQADGMSSKAFCSPKKALGQIKATGCIAIVPVVFRYCPHHCNFTAAKGGFDMLLAARYASQLWSQGTMWRRCRISAVDQL